MALWVDLFLKALLISVVTQEVSSQSQLANKINCDFEQQDLAQCGLVADNGANRFVVRKRLGFDAQFVPSRENEKGEYFLFRNMYHFMSSPEVSTVTTTAFTPSGSFCLHFWMYMASDKENEFIVERNTIENVESFTDVVKYTGNEAPTWEYKSVSFTSPSAFKLQLRLVVVPLSYSSRNLFALDDLVLDDGSCNNGGQANSNVSCNFEEGQCGFLSIPQPPLGDFQWVLQSYNLHQYAEGEIPSEDSTYHSSTGHFMVAPFRPMPGTGTRSCILRSPQNFIVPGEQQCLTFHYQIFRPTGQYPITLAVRGQETLETGVTESNDIWSSTTSHGTKWIVVKAGYHPFSHSTFSTQSANVTIDFTASGTKTANGGYVAVDDIMLTPGPCQIAGDCDFNVGSSGYCGWQSVTDDTVNMIWSNSKPTGGPVSTSGYIFFQGGRGSGNWVKSRAVLFSEDLDKDKARCMTFNYYFNSSGIAEIRIHQVETLTGKNVIWHHRGQLSDSEVVGNNGWRLARVPLQKTVCDVQPCSNTNKDFLIVIEARILREVNYQYYVAIDDLQFLHEEKEYVLIPASARPVDHEVEPPVEHATNVCNFDDDQMNEACGFEADENAPLQWHSRTGAEDEGSPSSMAPVFDHTTYEDIGQYLYFEQSSNLVTGDYARQISPIYQRDQPSDPRCIRFWYQLDTEIIWNDPLDLTGDFTVYVNASGNEQLRWSTREQFIWKTSEWKLGVLKEISNSTTFRIIFEAKLFYNKGHLMVALDDITVDNSECKELDCDFDEGMCGWHNYYNMNEPDAAFADLSWEYGDSSLTLPNGIADPFLEIHPRGLFVYVPIFSTTQARHQALLEHQEQMSAGRMVCLTFEFLITSTNKVGTISIAEKHYDYLLGDYKYTEIWLSNGGSKAGMWQSGQIAITNIITSAHNDWTLLFQGRANPTNATLSDAQHLLAIDTIRHRVITDADVNSCPPIPKEAAVSITTPSPPVITTTPTTNVSTMVLLNCSFNTDWCGFTNTPGSKPEWRRLDQSDGPSYAWFVPFRTNDHNGDLFLYQEFLKSSQNRYATVASSNVSALNGHEEYCLRFWTFMETYQSEKFKIIRQEHPGKREIIMKEFMGDAVVNWTLESIDFSSKSDFQILLSVDIPPNGDLIGILAVDELVLRRGLCSIDAPPSVETVCDFEEDSCGYESSGDSETVKWTRTSRLAMPSGDLLLLDLTPSEDNTDHSEEGHFAFAYLGPATDAIPSGVKRTYFTSPGYDIGGAHCVSFYYRNLKLSDKTGPNLALRTFFGAVDTDLWSSSVAHGKKWIAIKKTVKNAPSQLDNLKLQFIVAAAKGSKGSVALDDIAISPGNCQNPGDCSFNTGSTGFCSWTRLDSDETNMQWVNAKPNGGPPAESGYVFIEGGRNTGNLPKSRAVLYSEDLTYPTSESLCMTFMYFFNSSGAAVVRIHQVAEPKEYNPLWEDFGRSDAANTTFGTVNSVWKMAKIPIVKPKRGEDFLITIEAVILREVTVRYFMAIDDVQFLNQACSISPPDSLPLPTVAPPTEETADVCTFDDDVINNPLCGWDNNTSISTPNGPSVTWKLYNGEDQVMDSNLPAFDHSTLEDTGNYLYFNSTGQKSGNYGNVVSQAYTRVKETDPRCVRFWYQARGEKAGRLVVRFLPEDGIWISDGNPTRYWSLITLPAPANKLSFKLVFEGEVNSDNANGGFALDDIAVAPWACRQMDCDFEHGLCNWENYYDDSGTDELNWEYATTDLFPSLDDSIKRGFFLYTPVRDTTRPRHAAILRHTGVVPGGNRYCLMFDFLASNRNAGQLTIWLYWLTAQNDYDYSIIWQLSDKNPKIGEWQTAQIFINRMERWTLMIEALANPNNRTIPPGLHGIALDNIRHEQVVDANHCPTLPEVVLPPTPSPPITTIASTTPRSATTSKSTTTLAPSNTSFNCGFDSGTFCGWTQRDVDQYRWNIGSRNAGGNFSGDFSNPPAFDGKFIYIDAKAGVKGNKARLFSPSVKMNSPYCVRFRYKMNGKGTGNINLFFVNKGSTFNVNWAPPFTVPGGYYGDQWLGASHTIETSAEKSIVLEAIRGELDTGLIAVDEISINSGKCEAQGQCDFLSGWCNYSPFNSEYPSAYWQRVSGAAYLAINTTMDKIIPLRSEIFQSKPNACFRFKYSLRGSGFMLNVKTIQFNILDESTAPVHMVVWSQTITTEITDEKFVDGRIPISISSLTSFQISIEVVSLGLAVSSQKSAVYVDDITFSTSATCTHLPEDANPSFGHGITTVKPYTNPFSEATVIPSAVPTVPTPLSKYSCNFDDNNFCGWTGATGIFGLYSEVRWKLSNRALHASSGPETDHSGFGYFAYFDTLTAGSYITGDLNSPVLKYDSLLGGQVPPNFVLSFWYYMHGTGIDTLKVMTRRASMFLILTYLNQLTIQGDQGRRWFHKELVIPLEQGSFGVTFRGTRKSGNVAGLIAIDEILLLDEKIPDQFEEHTCDFDTPAKCSYDQVSDFSNIEWTWRNGVTTTDRNDTGPNVDKSQNAELGYYMAFDAKSQAVGSSVTLRSTFHQPTKEVCIKFYYYKRSNTQKRTLQLGISEDSVFEGTTVIWSDENMIGGDFWEPVFINMQSLDVMWRVHWEAVVVDPKQPIVAIDHVTLTDGVCQPNLLYCDFDKETFCEWSNDQRADDVNWMLTYGPSQVPGTGPSGDHGGAIHGGYILFDAAEADVPDTAALISTPITNEGRDTVCFKFWYHMYGADVGQLTVFQKDLLTGEQNAVWLLFHNRYNIWLQAQVPLTSRNNAPYQVILEATRLYNSGILGNIAIDEIDEDEDATRCPMIPGDAEVLPTPPTTTGTSVSPAPKSVNCTFEVDTCAWESSTETKMHWRRIAGYASSFSLGPSTDHTTQEQSGHYMIFEGSSGLLNDTARLDGPSLSGTICLKFYFHGSGYNLGHLKVLQKFENRTELLLWNRESPDEGRVWQFAELDVADSGSYSLTFEAVRGGGIEGDYALDDIFVNTGRCHPDGQKHFCNFENGLCGFQPGDADAMNFLWVSPVTTPYVSTSPLEDVSLGTASGHFVMATRVKSSNSSLAQIRTPLYSPTGNPFTYTPVCFKFFYYFASGGVRNESLEVMIDQLQTKTIVHRIYGHQGYSWMHATATLPVGAPFYALFNVSFDEKSTGTIVAIDDVSISNGTCTHPLDCEFGSDSLCLWHNLHEDEGYDKRDWRAASPALALTTGPALDQQGSSKGWFAVISAEIPSQPGDKAWLVSPEISANAHICFTFWYYMGGTDDSMSTLRLKAVDFEDSYSVVYWRVEKGRTGVWLPGKYGHSTSWPHNLVFEAQIGNNRQGFIALDSFEVIDNKCTDTVPPEASPSYKPPATTTPTPILSEFKCDFENGTDMCEWKNDEQNDDRCRWVLRKGPSESSNTGPSSDHTLQTKNGTYLYYQSSQCFDDSKEAGALLTTKIALSGFREAAQCLRFWYHMYGAPNTLLVAKNATSGDLRLEYLKKNNQGKQWRLAEVTIDNPDMGSYYIIIGATRGTSMFGDIALDDFEFTDGPCLSTQDICDFESGHLCGFSSVTVAGGSPSGAKFSWNRDKVMNLPDFATSKEPMIYDHTFAASEGHIAYANGKNFPKGAVAYLVSPNQTRYDNKDQCLVFWYQLPSQPDGGRLQVHLFRATLANQFANPVWSVGGGFQDAWEYGTVPITLTDDFKYAFEAVNGIKAFFALDDVMVINRTCPNPLACDFESGMCGWTNTMGDHFDWIIFQGDSSAGDNAGPTADHTTGTKDGHYIYVDNEYPNSMMYDTAHLTSERILISEETPWCFEFWYHMYIDSQSNASLSLVLRQFDDTSTTLWEKNQPGRNMWIRSNVNFSSDSDFRLTFIGTVHGVKGRSDIALDDFKGQKGRCSGGLPDDLTHRPCSNGTLIPKEKFCDQHPDCLNGEDERNCGSCEFSPGLGDLLCGYSIFTNDEFTWKDQRSVAMDRSFMYANSSLGPARASAYLDSPLIHETSANCVLEFYYRIDGAADPGSLLVSLRRVDTDSMLAIIDRTTYPSSSESGKWYWYSVNVGRHSGEFHLVFRARKSSVQEGGFGVDDIRMRSCNFMQPTVGACSSLQWKCPISQVCIEDYQVCDFVDDCGAGEDEQNCQEISPARCNFDVDFCDWSHDSTTSDFQWIRTNRATDSALLGPIRDHTTGLHNGGFIYVKASSSRFDTPKIARLLSPVFNATTDNQCGIRFYKYMFSAGDGMLDVVYLPVDGSGSSPWTLASFSSSTSESDSWVFHNTDITSRYPYRIALQARLQEGNTKTIALDDVYFTPSCSGGALTTTDATTTSTSASTVLPITSSTTRPTTTSRATPTLTTTATPTVTSTSTLSTRSTSVTDTTSTSPGSTTGTDVPCPGLWCAPSGTCLSESVLCDGKEDCPDGFDEAERECAPLPTDKPSDDGGLGGGEIAGIVIAVLAAVGLGGAGFVFWRRKLGPGIATRSSATGYKNFGALDGVNGEKDNVALDDIYSGDL